MESKQLSQELLSNVNYAQPVLLSLTLNCIRYSDLPLVYKGGSMEPPLKKTTFPPEF